MHDRRDFRWFTFFFHRRKDFTAHARSIPLPLEASSDCPIADISATDRSDPSSRTFLIGEQPNAWDLLQPRAKVSRHRGAELRRRYGGLRGTSLLSPRYLISVHLWPHL